MKKTTILILEDSQDSVEMFVDFLQDSYSLIWAKNIEEFSSKISECDAVLSDVWVSNSIDDFEFVKKLCKDSNKPLLAISGDIVKHYSYQLAKPISPSYLKLALDKVIKNNPNNPAQVAKAVA